MPRLILPRPIIFPIGPSIAYVPLTQGQFALIDSEDVERVGMYRWCADFAEGTQTFYARTHAKIADRNSTRLHRFILDLEIGFCDHRNGNTLDCRKSNLRGASREQNRWNSKTPKNNSSGIKGAQYNKRNDNWYSYIQIDGKKRFLGQFSTAQMAGNAYQKASVILQGEYAYHLREGV